MKIHKNDTALVVIDPQNHVLSEKGVSWPLVGASVKENNTVENLARLFEAAKQWVDNIAEKKGMRRTTRRFSSDLTKRSYFPKEPTGKNGGSGQHRIPPSRALASSSKWNRTQRVGCVHFSLAFSSKSGLMAFITAWSTEKR